MPTKKAAPVVEPETEMDDLDELEEETAEAEEKPKRTRKPRAKKEKVVPEGKTTKEVAEELGITPVRLRRILRTDDFYNDHIYSRYYLSEEVIERLKEAIASGAAEKKPRGRKKVESQEVEEISEELEELETDEEDELDFEDEDEEE